MSKHSTIPPDWMAQKTPTPIGEVLFHGTPLGYLLGILARNEISTGGDWRGEGDRVSLAKSYSVALQFGAQSDFDMYPSVIVLDWPKLAQSFKIFPHVDVDVDGNPWPNDEEEEAVYGNIRPLSRFLISVNIPLTSIHAAIEDDDFHQWIIHDGPEYPFMRTKRGIRNALLRLLNYPKLNVWHP